MKILIAILIALQVSSDAYSQVKILPINSIDTLANYKIIMTSTEWCQVCRHSSKIIQNSIKIDSLIQDEILFFKFNIEANNDVTFNNTTYKFSPNGVNIGIHEFLIFLSDKSNSGQIILPQFYIIHNDKIIQSYDNLLTENEWIRLIESLLDD